jgi:hypothetical protein
VPEASFFIPGENYMTEKEKSPAFQFYPKDWLTDDKVMGMTDAEKGVFIDLLAIQWLNEGVDQAVFDRRVITPLLQRRSEIWSPLNFANGLTASMM